MIIAKKSLGQNFLIDKEVLKLIVNLTSIENKSNPLSLMNAISFLDKNWLKLKKVSVKIFW